MAKKLFLNRDRAIPNAQVPSVSREELDSVVASSSRNSPVSRITKQLPFWTRRQNLFQNLTRLGVVFHKI